MKLHSPEGSRGEWRECQDLKWTGNSKTKRQIEETRDAELN